MSVGHDAPKVASPCIDICRMDEASGWCEGCLRTLDEIAAWGSLADAQRLEVLARLSERREVWTRHLFDITPAAPTR